MRTTALILALLVAAVLHAQTADLAVTFDAPETIQPGETLVMTATVTNLGPDPAPRVTVLSHGMPDQHFCMVPSMLGTLQPGETRALQCELTLAAGPPYILMLGLSAFSEAFDPVGENDGASRITRVLTPPDLFVRAEHEPFVKPGLTFPLTVNYLNRAFADATNVTVTITSPARIVSAPPSCIVDGNRAVCSIGNLPAASIPPTGGPGQIELTLEAVDASAVQMPVHVVIAADQADNLPQDDQFIATVRTYRTFFVTSTADAGTGSLRAAIDAASSSCSDPTPCLIAFRIPSPQPAVQTIRLQSPPGRVSGMLVYVDGTTQAAYFGDANGDAPDVEVISDATTGNGIELSACVGAVRGLSLTGFAGSAVNVLAPALDCPPYLAQAIVERNFIGLDAAGTSVNGNGRGVSVARGGTTVRNNVISGNRRSAVFVSSGRSFILDNILGFDAAAQRVIGNGASGVFIGPEASGTDVTGNRIAGSAHFGVAVARDATNVAVTGNSISGSGQLAIDWGLDGAATFEPVPIPEITAVRVQEGVTIVEGRTTAGGTFYPQVQLFANDVADPSGYGEGQHYLGETRDTANGTWSFTFSGDLRGKCVAATVTRHIYIGWLRRGAPAVTGDLGDYFTTTSEFSRCARVE